MNSEPTIVFFDGICHLCNRFVDEVIQRDTKKIFQFAPLQGQTAKKELSESDRLSLNTVVLKKGPSLFYEGEAIVKILRELPGWTSIAARLLSLLPLPVVNLFYRFVAKNRYAWFGQRNSCRLPLPEERDRLLP